ncbi:MAG: ABC transporter ATP-binding protein [Pseudomonadota bacterium]
MSDSSHPALIVSDLTKEVSSPEGSLTILDQVSFTLERGASLAIVGPSGAGKSTLLALLAGLDTPSRGDVQIDGASLGALDEDGRAALRAANVGFVFQSFHLVPSLNALENVMLPMELAGHADPRSRASEILTEVGLAPRARHYPNQLSGGEKQRVAIARAFASSPALLFADEPTGNLDTATGQKIVDLLFDLNQRAATTLVLVTHDLTLAARCQQTLALDSGRLVSLQ